MPIDEIHPNYPEFVIIGLTVDGSPFRPSDWTERLSGVMASFGDTPDKAYSPYCYPILSAGIKCVVVNRKLNDVEPRAYRFLIDFIQSNHLTTRPGRVKTRAEPNHSTTVSPPSTIPVK